MKAPDQVCIWPMPPPFMRECAQCHGLFVAVVELANAPVGCFHEQMILAKHIVTDHPDQVPAPHSDGCSLCAGYAKRNDGDPAGVWAEHRTRGLFMPAHVARLL